jgi:hypothetical protein
MKQPSKMPGRPNSRGRLSLNLLTDPERSTKIRGIQFPGKTGKGFSPPEKKSKKRKKKKKKKKLYWFVSVRHGSMVVGGCAVGDVGSQEPRYLT